MNTTAEQRAGKLVLVTGGSRGIGRATVLALSAAGWRVAVNYAANSTAAEEACHLAEAQGSSAMPFKADVGDPQQVDAMFRLIKESMGSPAALVNNAGITRDAPFVFMKDKDWDEVLRTNLSGVFYCCRKAVRAMIAHKWGRIINIASPSGVVGRLGQANYSASKGAVIALTRTLARELCRFNITVNALSPGVIDTEMTAGLPDEVKKLMLDAIPLGRFGTPAEIAGVAAFLASDSAGYITGQLIQVDGGLVMG